MIDIISEDDAQDILKVKKHDAEPIIKEEEQKIPLVSVDNLPSGFLGYPQGTKISYEPLTLGELESLNSGEMDTIRGIALLLKSIHCNTLKAEDLYYWDVMYIGIQRKLLAFGDTHGIIYNQCPSCGEIVEYEFDYTKIEFKELQAPNLPVITEIGGKEVEIGLLTIKDFLQVDVEKGELDVYARMIKNLPYEEAYDLVSNAHGKDSKKIVYIDKKLNYGMKPFIVKCENIIEKDNPEYNPDIKGSKKRIKAACEQKVRMEVRSPFEVVFPEDTDQGYFDAEIQYGRK